MDDDLMQRITDQFARQCIATRESLATEMLAAGLIDRGWTIAYRTWVDDDFKLHHECWPLHPLSKPEGA